ncbi:AbrB/MazE/SpoVT family DNA-binding domain-containing protein [Candidatus Riflebacteria bacterium]
MKANIARWGNSLGLRIPKTYANEIGITEGSEVELVVEGSSIVIKPRKYTLDELLEKVTPENIHPEIETGPKMGREEW